jgi:uracil-DNA glycosylase family 4
MSGEGPTPAKIMVIGQNPGQEEDATGRPFVGRSGRLLDELLAGSGIDRNAVFITNSAKCFSPGNRTPDFDELRQCAPYLQTELGKVEPRFVLTLGAPALYATQGKLGITANRGRVVMIGSIFYFPTFHPAAALRERNKLETLRADVKNFAMLVAHDGQINLHRHIHDTSPRWW